MDKPKPSLRRNQSKYTKRSDLPGTIKFANVFYPDTFPTNKDTFELTKKEREDIFVYTDASILDSAYPVLNVVVVNDDKKGNNATEHRNKTRHIIQKALSLPYSNVLLTYSSSSEVKDFLLKQLQNREKMRKAEINNANNEKKGNDGGVGGTHFTKMAENYLREAMELGASDLHIEATEGETAYVRFRVHKLLIDFDEVTRNDAKQLGLAFYSDFTRGIGEGQVKGIADGTYNESSLLDAEFSRNIGGDISLKARMVNIGLNHDDMFNIVLRLIDKTKTSEAIPYENLNFSKTVCKKLRILETASKGAVLIVGVTGSGKSTTMQNMVQHERDRSSNTRKIYTIEQPVETTISRVIQINASASEEKDVPPDKNFTFDNINKNLMRGDPDSIMYGEIRDSITAKAMEKGADSGHLAYGTMHVKSAIDVFPRLESFGLLRENITRNGFIALSICQHLLPKLCPHCATKYEGISTIPERYSEFDAIANYRSKKGDNKGMMRKILQTQKEIDPGASLLRELQRRNFIDAKEVFNLKNKIRLMNEGNDHLDFNARLQSVIRSSMKPADEVNVRFKGPGCKNCFNGTIGVAPVAEVLVPDDKFLSFVRDGQLDKAELHWKSNLGGITITEDSYEKIVSGMVDPRDAESELPDLLGS
jgi:type II secretory ATPase GspE/PulE/Tfp pilus assembly ATPase PilB-like protein